MLGTAKMGTLADGSLRSRGRPNLSHHDHGWHILADRNGLCLTGGHIVDGQPAKAQPSTIPPHLQVALCPIKSESISNHKSQCSSQHQLCCVRSSYMMFGTVGKERG